MGEDDGDDGQGDGCHPAREGGRLGGPLPTLPAISSDRPGGDARREQDRLGYQRRGVEEADEAEQLAEPDQQGDGEDDLDQPRRRAVPGGQELPAQTQGREADRRAQRREQGGAQDVGANSDHLTPPRPLPGQLQLGCDQRDQRGDDAAADLHHRALQSVEAGVQGA